MTKKHGLNANTAENNIQRISMSSQTAKLTYGEAHIEYKNSLHLATGGELAGELPSHKKRMPRKEAAKYYTAKIRAEFKKLGYC